eukprot:NODE_90_length_21577_cov_0.697691.p13 type:complete len:163 gc:universal NODE_90_length_21577_cov_0.697691:18757-19245(+)
MHQVIIYVHPLKSDSEEVVLLPVSLNDTTLDVIQITLDHLKIPFHPKYKLYESKFVPGKCATSNSNSLKKPNRQLLRELHDTECPLVILYSWFANKDRMLMNLILKPCEGSLKHDKLYEKLPLESLKRRLNVLEREEEKRLSETKLKYENMRRMIIRRLSTL